MRLFVIVVFCLISFQFAYSQEKEDIMVKDDIVLINKEGKSVLSAGSRIDKLLLKKESILSITVGKNSVIIRIGFQGSALSIYEYDCQTNPEAQSFFNKLMKKLYDI